MNENFTKAFAGLICSITLQLTTQVQVSIAKDVFASIAQIAIAALTIITIYKTVKEKKRK